MNSTVNCQICGHSAVTLARHLKAVHGVTAESYRAQHPGARIRSEACEANRHAAFVKAHAEKPKAGLKKTVTCPSCGTPREVGYTFAPSVHDSRCLPCRETEEAAREEAKWLGKIEGVDYVTCVGCSYRGNSLISHINSKHPEWVGCYPGQQAASSSKLFDKSYLKGRQLSEETKAKMSENAGRWNKGHTKETDPRIAVAAESMKGRVGWSKGLTKADHPSLQSASDKLSDLKRGVPNDAARFDLSLIDFTPFLDATGAVDRKMMAEELGVCEPTVTKYMSQIGVRLSTKYRYARIQRDEESGRFHDMSQKSAALSTIRLTQDQLDQFKLKDGRVVLAKAMAGLGHVYAVIKRECERLGIPTYTHLVKQSFCLEAIAKALGGVPFEQEWRSRKFVNPPTGHRFRFDGYFPSHDLIVEFHGYQHWVFPSVYIQREELFFALQERDRIKENLIQADPVLRYFVVREDELYADAEYLRGRLIDEGVLSPGK